MTLKEVIKEELRKLSEDPNVVFLGENIINSGRIYGTMDDVPINKCLEMPVAENLIAGCGIGLALAGKFPVVVFQRMDFMLIAADAIINHACLMPKMCPQVKIPIIFITFKAKLKDSFYAGLQHTKDLSHIFELYMTVLQIHGLTEIDTKEKFTFACKTDKPILIVIEHENLNNEL